VCGGNVDRGENAEDIGLHRTVSRPSSVMTMEDEGRDGEEIPTIMTPLIMLPKRRMAKASVRRVH